MRVQVACYAHIPRRGGERSGQKCGPRYRDDKHQCWQHIDQRFHALIQEGREGPIYFVCRKPCQRNHNAGPTQNKQCGTDRNQDPTLHRVTPKRNAACGISRIDISVPINNYGPAGTGEQVADTGTVSSPESKLQKLANLSSIQAGNQPIAVSSVMQQPSEGNVPMFLRHFLFWIPHAHQHAHQDRYANDHDRKHAEVRFHARLKMVGKWPAYKEPCTNRDPDNDRGGKKECDPMSHGSTF
jgi:hypothetical protein